MHWAKKISYGVAFTVLITFWAIVVAAIDRVTNLGSAELAYASLNWSFFNRSFDWMFAGFSMLFGGLVLSPDRRHASPTLIMGLVLAFTIFFVNVALSLFHPYLLQGWAPMWPVLISSALGLVVLGTCAGLS
jgi:hypothetical protein